jgi:hypothetical protein
VASRDDVGIISRSIEEVPQGHVPDGGRRGFEQPRQRLRQLVRSVAS